MTAKQLKEQLEAKLQNPEISKGDRNCAQSIIDMIDMLDHAWKHTLAACEDLDAKGQNHASARLGSNMQQRVYGAIEALKTIAFSLFPDIKPEEEPSVFHIKEVIDHEHGRSASHPESDPEG